MEVNEAQEGPLWKAETFGVADTNPDESKLTIK